MSDAPINTYTERRWGLRRHFQLHSDRLVIVVSRTFGSDAVTPVSLRNVNPQYGIIRYRKQFSGLGAIIIGGIFAVLFAFGLFALVLENFGLAVAAFGIALYCVS